VVKAGYICLEIFNTSFRLVDTALTASADASAEPLRVSRKGHRAGTTYSMNQDGRHDDTCYTNDQSQQRQDDDQARVARFALLLLLMMGSEELKPSVFVKLMDHVATIRRLAGTSCSR
jgi:hypothetical protein